MIHEIKSRNGGSICIGLWNINFIRSDCKNKFEERVCIIDRAFESQIELDEFDVTEEEVQKLIEAWKKYSNETRSISK